MTHLIHGDYPEDTNEKSIRFNSGVFLNEK